MACAICEIRKEKRFCPAVHGRICPICCGREREVTLDCPSSCEYLQQARRNERPRQISELDQEALFPKVEVRHNFVYEREPLIVGLSFGVARVARTDRSINDRDAIAAITALARKYETLTGSGLYYETAVASVPQQRIVAELEKMIVQYRELEQKHLGYSTLKDSESLEALVFLVRMAHRRTSGRPKSRAFVDFLFEQFPEKSGVVAPAEAGSRLIVP
ncbi:MAG TPA: hypothetical protein VE734_00255 [Terriglobales bacterium]|jgi:hypothetical protein|nr:hypothetical protein [Terriglobales bacterium]